MTRNEKLREEAAIRRMNKASKESALNAFVPPVIEDYSHVDDEDDWGDVLTNARGVDNGWD